MYSILLLGCEEFETEVAFEAPIKGRTINLSNKVGESFQIIRENDTVKYTLYFDKASDYNYLVKSDTDTVFAGTVTKRKELYLLNRSIENEAFAIHALKFTDSSVTGLETEWLQSSIINNRLEDGEYTNLIIDTAGVKTIQAGKKDAKDIFRLVLEQLEPEVLISNHPDYLEDEFTNDTLKIESQNNLLSEKELIKKVYPNPFIDFITIELNKKAPYVFSVFDLKGKQIKTSKQNTEEMKLALPNLKQGYYILKILSHDTGIQDEVKLLKK